MRPANSILDNGKLDLNSFSDEAVMRPAAQDLFRAQSALVDGLLRDMWCARDLPANAALVAVGGYGRGQLFPHSDIDLLVDFDAVRRGIIPLAGFAHEVEEIMGRSVDVTTVQLLRDRVRSRALREAVPL